MRKMLKPAIQYDLREYLRPAGVFFGVIVLVLVFFAVQIMAVDGNESARFTGMGIASGIFLFVLGVADIREKLRLMNQFGLSRSTAYGALVVSLAILAVGLSAAMEAASALFQLGFGGNSLRAGDLYQMIYLGGADTYQTMTLSQHLVSVLFSACLILSLAILGQFFSLLFWRLSKRWIVAVAVGIPILCNLVPWTVFRISAIQPGLTRAAAALFHFWGASPWNFILTCLILTAVGVAVNWLLLRRAVIRAPR